MNEKKLTPKQAMKINSRLGVVVMAAAAVLLIGGNRMVEIIAAVCGMFALVAACIVFSAYCRCPRCGKALGYGRDAQWSRVDFCPHCGGRIE